MRIENTQKRVYSYDEKNPIYSGTNTRVYNATDEVFNRKVCIKVLSYKTIGSIGEAMIKKEVIALCRAGSASTHVPMIFDFWSDDKTKSFYIVMQLIPGETLRKKMKLAERTRFNQWMISLADTLALVHNEHIYHKDIKPENVIITQGGDVYLIDFNISVGTANLNDGTQFYRAPEMYKGGIAVAREQSDVFSLGVMMYEYYTGVRPVEGVNYGTSMLDSNSNCWTFYESAASIRTDMPKQLSDIIEKCMKRSPSERYRRIADLKRDLINVSKEIRGWKN